MPPAYLHPEGVDDRATTERLSRPAYSKKKAERKVDHVGGQGGWLLTILYFCNGFFKDDE